jgi:hypothetical protein
MRIEHGTLTADHEMPNWDLDQGRGIRTCTYREDFKDAFDEVPVVSVSLSGLDVVSVGSRVAVESDVVAVDTAGFEVKFTAHHEQQVRSATVDWLALGD